MNGPRDSLVGIRGEFYLYHNADVVEIYIGEKGDHESDFVMAIHNSLIPNMIATLRLSQDKAHK